MIKHEELTSETARDNKFRLYEQDKGVQRYQSDEDKCDGREEDTAIEKAIHNRSDYRMPTLQELDSRFTKEEDTRSDERFQ